MTTTAVVTAFIALTTVFTPPPSCSNSWTFEPSTFNAVPSGLFVQNAIAGSFDANCWPVGFTKAGRAEKSDTVVIYSPGYCPVGYSTALLVPGGVTSVTCCPSNFAYTASSASSAERADGALAGCISTYSAAGTTTVLARPLSTLVPDNLLVTSTLSNLGDVTMWAQPITVAYQQKDLSLYITSTNNSSSSTAASTTGSSASGKSASGTSSGSASPPAATTSNSSSGLSTGAKAGIGVGVGGGVLALLALGIFALMRRRRRKVTPAVMDSNQDYPQPHEMDGGGRRAEMALSQNPATKINPSRLHELPGSKAT